MHNVEKGHTAMINTHVTLAEEYAESVAAGIVQDCENGHPFGFSDYDEETELDGFDLLSESLDYEYRVDGFLQYQSCRVMISAGGPNAWIDTATGELVVYWGYDKATRALPAEYIESIDYAAAEFFSAALESRAL